MNDTKTEAITLEELHNRITDALSQGKPVDDLMKLDIKDEATENTPAPVVEVQTEQEEPKEEATPEETPATVAADTPEDGAPKTDAKVEGFEWVENLPEDTKAKVQQLIEARETAEHKFKSNLGRVRAFQGYHNEDQRTIAELQKQLQQQKPLAETPAAKLERSEDLERYAETDPQFARVLQDYVQKAIDQSHQHIAKGIDERFEQVGQAIYHTEQQRYSQAQRQLVLEEFPNATEVVADPYFNEWLKHQPPGERAKRNSPHAADAIDLLWRYHGFLEQSGFIQKQAEPAKQTEKVVAKQEDPKATQEAERIQQARTQRTAPQVTTSKPAPKTSGEDQSLEYWFKKGQSKARERYGG